MEAGKIVTYRKGGNLYAEVVLPTKKGPITIRSSLSERDVETIRTAIYAWVHQHNRKALAVSGIDPDDVMSPSFTFDAPRSRRERGARPSPPPSTRPRKGALARALDPDATMDPDWDKPAKRRVASAHAAFDPDAPMTPRFEAPVPRRRGPVGPDEPLPFPSGRRAPPVHGTETIRPDFSQRASARSASQETLSPFSSSGAVVCGWISGEEKRQIAQAHVRSACIGALTEAASAIGFGEFYAAEPVADPVLSLNPKPDRADFTEDESFVDDASHEDAMLQLQAKGSGAIADVFKDTMYGEDLGADASELGQWKRLKRIGKKIRRAAAAAGRKFVPGRDKKKAKLVKQTYDTLVVRRANFLAWKRGSKKPTSMETMLAKVWAKEHLRKHGLPTTVSGDEVSGKAKASAQQDVSDMPMPPSTLPEDDEEIRDVQKILYAMSMGASSAHVRHWQGELAGLDAQIARAKARAAGLRTEGRLGLAIAADRDVLDLEKRAGDYRLKLAQASTPGAGSNIMGAWWKPWTWFAKKSQKALSDAEPEAPSQLPEQEAAPSEGTPEAAPSEEAPAEAPAEAPTEAPSEEQPQAE